MRILHDTWLIFVRQMRPTLRNPVAVFVFGMLQPVLYLALFGPLLSGMPGALGSDSWQWFVPGLLAMLGLFGTAFAGFGLLPELRSGSHERLLTTPVSRVALLLGRVLRDITVLLVQAVIVIAAAVPFGFDPSFPGAVLGLLLLALLGVGLGIFSYLAAMVAREEYIFAGILQTVSLPLILLSGILLPMDLAPDWLYAVSRANPIVYVVEAERALFAGDLSAPSVAYGGMVAVAVTAVALVFGSRRMRRINT
ncbi:ABC-2 type transport system permease protein [Haloactinospora alba]|uniref:Transport permease protein n=1 Tax=Haloactinospora alba TaxID=405555 RepID=A0A543NH99_9ACTN|nr:ABC transporter permease [Haloactinospora alba]TQN31201.1 ABC-2 type transport system permease protein [Haloactinospora alba]